MTDELHTDEPPANPLPPSTDPLPKEETPATLLGDNADLVTVRVEAGHEIGGVVYQAGSIVETPRTPEVAAHIEAGLLKEIT